MTTHASDCALHNAPALPPGPCDCGADNYADAAAPRSGSFHINGEHRFSIDDVHRELFGFGFHDRALTTTRGTQEEPDAETATRVFALFKYNIRPAPLSRAFDGSKYATVAMKLPRSLVDMLGPDKARVALQNELLGLLEPFRGAAAFWRQPPMVEDCGSAGMGIYARVHLMLAHEYEMLFPVEMKETMR